MKKLLVALLTVASGFVLASAHTVHAYNFGDARSETLVSKAWGSLNEGDIEGVLAYTNKALELYGEPAAKMQESLDGYVEGTKDDVFSYWALNDVATSLYIQAEAYRKADMLDEAKDVYKKLINEFTYGQCWDSNGWFWKPADAAKEKLAMIETGSNLDFGDYSSAFLASQAWKSLESNDVDSVKVYTDKVMELYDEQAKTMQNSLTEYAWESNDEIFKYWALNDVGTALYVRGEVLKKSGDVDGAKEAYKMLVDEYYYAQCWDPNGWFWKPAEAAQQALEELAAY